MTAMIPTYAKSSRWNRVVAEAVHREEREDGRHDREGDDEEKVDEEHERERGLAELSKEVAPAPPGGARRVVGRNRLGQDEVEQHGVREGERGGEVEGRADVPLREHAADGRAEDEPEAEGRSEHPHPLRAVLRRRHVGDVSLRRRDVAARDAVEDAARKQHPERRRRAHNEKAQSVPIRLRSRTGRRHACPRAARAPAEEELHHEYEVTEPERDGRRLKARALQIVGQDGMTMPKPTRSMKTVMKMTSSGERFINEVMSDE